MGLAVHPFFCLGRQLMERIRSLQKFGRHCTSERASISLTFVSPEHILRNDSGVHQSWANADLDVTDQLANVQDGLKQWLVLNFHGF